MSNLPVSQNTVRWLKMRVECTEELVAAAHAHKTALKSWLDFQTAFDPIEVELAQTRLEKASSAGEREKLRHALDQAEENKRELDSRESTSEAAHEHYDECRRRESALYSHAPSHHDPPSSKHSAAEPDERLGMRMEKLLKKLSKYQDDLSDQMVPLFQLQAEHLDNQETMNNYMDVMNREEKSLNHRAGLIAILVGSIGRLEEIAIEISRLQQEQQDERDVSAETKAELKRLVDKYLSERKHLDALHHNVDLGGDKAPGRVKDFAVLNRLLEDEPDLSDVRIAGKHRIRELKDMAHKLKNKRTEVQGLEANMCRRSAEARSSNPLRGDKKPHSHIVPIR